MAKNIIVESGAFVPPEGASLSNNPAAGPWLPSLVRNSAPITWVAGEIIPPERRQPLPDHIRNGLPQSLVGDVGADKLDWFYDAQAGRLNVWPVEVVDVPERDEFGKRIDMSTNTTGSKQVLNKLEKLRGFAGVAIAVIAFMIYIFFKLNRQGRLESATNGFEPDKLFVFLASTLGFLIVIFLVSFGLKRLIRGNGIKRRRAWEERLENDRRNYWLSQGMANDYNFAHDRILFNHVVKVDKRMRSVTYVHYLKSASTIQRLT